MIDYTIEDILDPSITLGGAVAHSLEQAAGSCDLPEEHPVWWFIDDLRDAGDDIIILHRIFDRIGIKGA